MKYIHCEYQVLFKSVQEKNISTIFQTCIEIVFNDLLRGSVSLLVPLRKEENEKVDLVYYLGKINVKANRAPQPSGVRSESDTAQ